MQQNKKQMALIGGLVVVLGLVVLAFSEVNFSKLVKVNKNIMHNIAEGTHHIYMGHDVSVDYIKNHTGSSHTVDMEDLPQALKPMKKYKHPPFSMGACQVCHAPKRSKPAAIVTHTVQELCYKCHVPEEQPEKEINCNKCHSPHSAEKEHLIRKKATATECPVGKFEY
ncbi:cytochrome c3 family protein [Hydrogenimonas sp.]